VLGFSVNRVKFARNINSQGSTKYKPVDEKPAKLADRKIGLPAASDQ